MIFQDRGRPQGNINKKEIRLFPKKTRCSTVEAARRTTSTKMKFVYFQKNAIIQGRGRPQGNINNKESRDSQNRLREESEDQ